MVQRRPSIYASSGYVEDQSPQQIQRAIQTLRLRTQEALSESQEEIARLEEEKEIAEMRIQEIEQEMIEMAGEDDVGSLQDRGPVEEKKDNRRWSLGLSLGGGGNNQQQKQQPQQLQQQQQLQQRGMGRDMTDDTIGSTTTVLPGGRRNQLAGLRDLGTPGGAAGGRGQFNQSRSLRSLGLFPEMSAMEREERLMDQLHRVQEQNKKEIGMVSSNLEFKEEQVTALQLTAQSQEQIMEKLHVDIAHLQLKKLVPTPNEPSLEEVKKIIKVRSKALEEIRHKTNELSSNLRSLRRIQNVDERERDLILTDLRQKVVAANIRLKSTTAELEANTEILNGDFNHCHQEWRSVHVQVALMERVSQKQLRRVQKKVSQGKPREELRGIVGRAKTAVEEELMMRREDPCPASQWRKECEQMETLNNLVLKCSRAIIEGISPVLSKDVSRYDLTRTLVYFLDDVKGALESSRDTTDAFLVMVEEKLQTYHGDEALLPPAIQDEIKNMTEKDGSDSEEGGEAEVSDEATAFTEFTDTTDVTNNKGAFLRTIDENNELEQIMKREVEIDELLRKERKRLEGVKERATNEKAAWKGKIHELRQMFKQGKLDWSKKDRVLNRALAEVEELKQREDELRLIVREGRSRLKAK